MQYRGLKVIFQNGDGRYHVVVEGPALDGQPPIGCKKPVRCKYIGHVSRGPGQLWWAYLSTGNGRSKEVAAGQGWRSWAGMRLVDAAEMAGMLGAMRVEASPVPEVA